MYGLVNNGVRTFIIDAHGEDRWKSICDRASVQDQEFENLSAYDDDITFALVAAVSEELSIPTDEVLEVFGRYWVPFAKSTAIGRLIDQGAEDLIDQIRGLDEMHERVQMTMPHLNPPSFEFEEGPDGSHRLHYYSIRQGLAPMIVGLLHGMAEGCGVAIDVAQIESRKDGADHDVFSLKILAQSATAA